MVIHKVVGVILILSVHQNRCDYSKKIDDLKCNNVIDSVARTHLFSLKSHIPLMLMLLLY